MKGRAKNWIRAMDSIEEVGLLLYILCEERMSYDSFVDPYFVEDSLRHGRELCAKAGVWKNIRRIRFN